MPSLISTLVTPEFWTSLPGWSSNSSSSTEIALIPDLESQEGVEVCIQRKGEGHLLMRTYRDGVAVGGTAVRVSEASFPLVLPLYLQEVSNRLGVAEGGSRLPPRWPPVPGWSIRPVGVDRVDFYADGSMDPCVSLAYVNGSPRIRAWMEMPDGFPAVESFIIRADAVSVMEKGIPTPGVEDFKAWFGFLTADMVVETPRAVPPPALEFAEPPPPVEGDTDRVGWARPHGTPLLRRFVDVYARARKATMEEIHEDAYTVRAGEDVLLFATLDHVETQSSRMCHILLSGRDLIFFRRGGYNNQGRGHVHFRENGAPFDLLLLEEGGELVVPETLLSDNRMDRVPLQSWVNQIADRADFGAITADAVRESLIPFLKEQFPEFEEATATQVFSKARTINGSDAFLPSYGFDTSGGPVYALPSTYFSAGNYGYGLVTPQGGILEVFFHQRKWYQGPRMGGGMTPLPGVPCYLTAPGTFIFEPGSGEDIQALVADVGWWKYTIPLIYTMDLFMRVCALTANKLLNAHGAGVRGSGQGSWWERGVSYSLSFSRDIIFGGLV